jgi:histidine triad (HIT) family protein
MQSDCLFCRIIAGEIPSTAVYADDLVFAIRDISPQAPTHILLLSRKHIASVNELEEADQSTVGKMAGIAAKLAEKEKIAADGYRLVINNGLQAGQSVPHLHMHLLGGRPMAWPPG